MDGSVIFAPATDASNARCFLGLLDRLQKKLALFAGREVHGLVPEMQSLVVEPLLEDLLMLDAGTLSHDAVPFCERKAERNSVHFVIYERIVQEYATKIDKARIFFHGSPIFSYRAVVKINSSL
ncbi:hypothetical protein GGQ85_002105 [Nitrobacter vulgaris]|uniref:hypothetical protein n=1 Tax=Nitrobacter vulgaris TaxID=29421 RepID=UPI00285B0EDF|nr:hypothetical protein [Nitrobacter vulgaris]MDR6304398.1 hypothetical protein [Nitrobacter vulgaris]